MPALVFTMDRKFLDAGIKHGTKYLVVRVVPYNFSIFSLTLFSLLTVALYVHCLTCQPLNYKLWAKELIGQFETKGITHSYA